MKRYVIFETEKGNRYLYSDKMKSSILMPPLLENFVHDSPLPVEKDENGMQDYYKRKYHFLKNNGIEKSRVISFVTKPNPEEIKTKLANLKQIVFEVTDACNLKCFYCGYGEMYWNHDKRLSNKLPFTKVKLLLDYMMSLWNSSYNFSFNNTIDISFYGGEPLLNIELIKQTIAYIEDSCSSKLSFSYRMTTNAMLLDKYMDYLVSKDFHLLISLDGNEYGNSYRVTKNGLNSFSQVIKSIETLKGKYPDFYNTNIAFNAVLHDRNDYGGIYSYIKDLFDKVPTISELSDNGIHIDKMNLFKQMFKSTYEGQKQFYQENESVHKTFTSPEYLQTRSLIHGYTGNTYKSLNELLKTADEIRHLPSGTCLAFYKKVFLTVNGKILPCERIGQNYPLGFVDNDKVEIDFNYIASLYDKMYTPLTKLCNLCFFQSNCSQCVFNIFDKKMGNKLYCPTFANKRVMADYLRENMSYLETHPNVYEEVIQKDLLI